MLYFVRVLHTVMMVLLYFNQVKNDAFLKRNRRSRGLYAGVAVDVYSIVKLNYYQYNACTILSHQETNGASLGAFFV